MRNHLQGIDHVVIAVHDTDRAGATYRRFGFTLTPKGRHTTGSENHCVMFEHDYFELLGVPVPHPVNQSYQQFLLQGEGLAAIALATDDARGFHDELAADGIGVAEPVDFSRPVQLASGMFDAAFRITQVAPQATAGWSRLRLPAFHARAGVATRIPAACQWRAGSCADHRGDRAGRCRKNGHLLCGRIRRRAATGRGRRAAAL